MRQPLWILNSVLFFLVILIALFMLFSRVTVIERESIRPEEYAPAVVKEVSRINIKRIYEDDLFDTRKRLPDIPQPEHFPPLPRPPRPLPVRIPEAPETKFLDPLDIALKGVMFLSDGSDSSAVIQDNKTNRESVYKIGDMIEDAQLIRIFNNKVIFVRSNGQQEVFYLREKDALNDPTFLNIDDWKEVVKKVDVNLYEVSPSVFSKRIKNLAQFIDLLGLTSAYRKGESVGCRIGDIKDDSLGDRLGLKTGDIVLTINNIPARTTADRLDIYKAVVSSKIGDTISVVLQRGQQSYTLSYAIKEFIPSKKPAVDSGVSVTPEYIKEEQKRMLEKKYKFAPTAKDIRNLERRNMFRKGGKPSKHLKSKFAE